MPPLPGSQPFSYTAILPGQRSTSPQLPTPHPHRQTTTSLPPVCGFWSCRGHRMVSGAKVPAPPIPMMPPRFPSSYSRRTCRPLPWSAWPRLCGRGSEVGDVDPCHHRHLLSGDIGLEIERAHRPEVSGSTAHCLQPARERRPRRSGMRHTRSEYETGLGHAAVPPSTMMRAHSVGWPFGRLFSSIGDGKSSNRIRTRTEKSICNTNR